MSAWAGRPPPASTSSVRDVDRVLMIASKASADLVGSSDQAGGSARLLVTDIGAGR
jgi:hypothetical protein